MPLPGAPAPALQPASASKASAVTSGGVKAPATERRTSETMTARLHTCMFFVLAAALVTACAQRVSTLPAAPQSLAVADLRPPKCDGQKDTKQYASLTVTLSTSGGKFCIPEYRGFGGSVKYPSANPSVQLSLISSTKNYDGMPELGSGTAIFYLQLALSGGTSFGSNARAGGGLTSKKIAPGKAYTAYGQAVVDGFKVNFGPCYSTATKGKYGGVLGGIGSLLKDQDVPVAATGVIEIYEGRQTSEEC